MENVEAPANFGLLARIEIPKNGGSCQETPPPHDDIHTHHFIGDMGMMRSGAGDLRGRMMKLPRIRHLGEISSFGTPTHNPLALSFLRGRPREGRGIRIIDGVGGTKRAKLTT